MIRIDDENDNRCIAQDDVAYYMVHALLSLAASLQRLFFCSDGKGNETRSKKNVRIVNTIMMMTVVEQ